MIETIQLTIVRQSARVHQLWGRPGESFDQFYFFTNLFTNLSLLFLPPLATSSDMPVSDPSSSNLSDSSPKGSAVGRSTSETPSTGTRPRSRASLDASSTTGRVRVPAKRARKTINCGPCRLSKLKCDRYSFSPLCSCRSHYDLPLRPENGRVPRANYEVRDFPSDLPHSLRPPPFHTIHIIQGHF